MFIVVYRISLEVEDGEVELIFSELKEVFEETSSFYPRRWGVGSGIVGG
jgi:hypothetical protein